MTPVSVIVTCYNLERYIGQAIESVLGQQFEGPVDLIVVDDCSTDGSAAIIQSYDRARYLRTPINSGVLLATLAGLEAASNDLIFFLDGDDFWDAGKLAAVSACFEAHPRAALVTHDLRYVDPAGEPLARDSLPQRVMSDVAPERYSQAIQDGILYHGDYVWLGSAFAIRRSKAELDAFIAWARSLPDPANVYQDWPLAYWIAALPDVELGYVPDKLFSYRLHGLNYSGDAATPEKALRNLRRTYNTVAALRDIAAMRGLRQEIQRLLAQRLEFFRYLIDLYSGHRIRAGRGWFRSIPFIRRHGLFWKESARLLAIQLLGAERFAALAARRGRSSP